MDFLYLIIGALIGGGAVWMMKYLSASRKPHQDEPEKPVIKEDIRVTQLEDRVSQLQQQFIAAINWHTIQVNSIASLAANEPIAQIAAAIVNNFASTLTDFGVFLALWIPKKPNDMICTLRDDSALATILTVPQLSADSAHDVLIALEKSLRGSSKNKAKWYTSQSLEIDTDLIRLLQHDIYGIIAPIYYLNDLIGVFFITSSQLKQTNNLTRIIGDSSIALGQILSFAIMQFLTEKHTADTVKPSDVIKPETPAKIVHSEKNETAAHNSAAASNKIILQELAAYSQLSMLRSQSPDQMIKHTCISLLHICNVDCAMILQRTEKNAFAVEHIEMKRWSWSKHSSHNQNENSRHGITFDAAAFESWPDPFVPMMVNNCHPFSVDIHNGITRFAPRLRQEGFQSVLAYPVVFDKACQAIIVIAVYEQRGFSEQIRAAISSITAKIAMILNIVNSVSNNKYGDTANTPVTSPMHNFSALLRMNRVLINNRAEEISSYSYQLARQMKVDEPLSWAIRMAALVCDVGMMMIPPSVLHKTDQLSEEDWVFIHQHPIFSESLLSGYDDFQNLLPIVRSHHERWNGSGYPDHLNKTDIPLGARILAVADTFISMQTPQKYRSAMTPEEALDAIAQLADILFDPDVVAALQYVINHPAEFDDLNDEMTA